MEGFSHPSSWTARALRDHAAVQGRGPWQTEDADLTARIDAAAEATRRQFAHLSVEAILHPPHAWFDAALARQVVLHVLEAELAVPRRAIAAVSLMTREAIGRGGRVIARRASDAAFASMVAQARGDAANLYRQSRPC